MDRDRGDLIGARATEVRRLSQRDQRPVQPGDKPVHIRARGRECSIGGFQQICRCRRSGDQHVATDGLDCHALDPVVSRTAKIGRAKQRQGRRETRDEAVASGDRGGLRTAAQSNRQVGRSGLADHDDFGGHRIDRQSRCGVDAVAAEVGRGKHGREIAVEAEQHGVSVADIRPSDVGEARRARRRSGDIDMTGTLQDRDRISAVVAESSIEGEILELQQRIRVARDECIAVPGVGRAADHARKVR